MQILIVGFQRSGTTLLRRLIELHPEVRRVFHERFLLRDCKDLDSLKRIIENNSISIYNQNWGEKCPYYPSIRRIPVIKYCETWNNYFGKTARIVHIIRHPYDVAFSNVKKFNNINNIGQPIKLYRGIVSVASKAINNMSTGKTFKYEDLLLYPDKTLREIYDFCGLDPTFNFTEKMKNVKNKKYQSFDESRVFAYKKKDFKKIDISKTVSQLNSFGLTKYEG